MSGMEAWYMDESSEDQRLPHRLSPNQPVTREQLQDIGVYYWKVRSGITHTYHVISAETDECRTEPFSNLFYLSFIHCP